ncbi:acyltransferase family protein [Sphingomonas montanisoli]|uniref:acyltransferase family protein n=1 Tax=Sphingomonas montanisoli TaxID=2606412 RepID=UPI0015E19FFB|nr:acyltransferase [Sphingomonas montanisoli]
MLFNLQVLRAIAALLVVCVHLEAPLVPLGVARETLMLGNSGVDLFFVISGFVMVYTTAHRPSGPVDFMVNRIIRVAPLYWLATLALFAVALVLPQLLHSTKSSWGELILSLLFVPFDKGGKIQPVFFLGWTLNLEMFFYVLFAFALLLRGVVARVALVTAILLALVWTGPLWPKDVTAMRFYSTPIMLEFAIGMWIAIGYLRGIVLPRLPAFAALAGGFVLLVGSDYMDGGARSLWTGIGGGVVLIAALSLEKHGHVWKIRIAQLLGTASYALYLSHPFVVPVVSKAARSIGPSQGWPAIIWLTTVIMIAVMLVAIAIHLWVEQPITYKLRRKAHHPPSVVDKSEASAASGARC